MIDPTTQIRSTTRSAFLVFATVVANLYLVGFGADAVVSVLDETLRLAFSVDALSQLRTIVALAVLAATVPVLFLLIFVPHLPRGVLLPPLVFCLWTAFGAPPLGGSGRAGVVALIAVIQLVLAANAIRLARRYGGRLLLAADRMPVLRHLWLRAVGACAVATVVGVALLVAFVTTATVAYFEAESGGYMQFRWTGIEMRETVLRHGGTTVHLVATSHFAESAFYEDLHARIPPDALVLVEGVTDRGGRLSGLSYGKVAALLGLSTQDVFNDLLPRPESAETAPIEAAAPAAAAADVQAHPAPGEVAPLPGPRVIRADVDTVVFSDRAIEFLEGVQAIYGGSGLEQALQTFLEWNGKFTEAEVAAIFHELIEQRNAHLMGEFDRRAAAYRTVFIPWGAMHMPGLEHALAARDYRVVGVSSTPFVRYDTLLRSLL